MWRLMSYECDDRDDCNIQHGMSKHLIDGMSFWLLEQGLFREWLSFYSSG
jgi:hypothetical protein